MTFRSCGPRHHSGAWRDELDPEGRMLNPYLKQLLGA